MVVSTMMPALMVHMDGAQLAQTQASTTRPGDIVNLAMKKTAISLTSGAARTSTSVFRRAAMEDMDGVEPPLIQAVNTTHGSIALLMMLKRALIPLERQRQSLERTVCQ